MSLSKAVARAVDSAFADPRLAEFSPIDAVDATTLRRYYRGSRAREQEVLVYRDEWWSKSGGAVFVELFCLVGEVQRALGGCDQSWLRPDYDKPIVVFQYRTSRDARSTERSVASRADAENLGSWLADFLVTDGLEWFTRFESNESITDYMRHESMQIQLAGWHAHLGDAAAALDAFRAYMLGLPRQIERELAEMESIGIISESERKTLLKASIQQHSDYEREIERWCASREP